ncbi:hypothetical protein [Roseburia sp. 1XD42-69]|uniref:hypothetical protein n=1 Tax=Roseburia sp. 1XD42-69 TaxID=2320088 RepID=UPI000EA057C4|nr:hypothetical protein [Roseburia sp. 1XD42-69]MCX4319949.1 hypothetical protein [Lachnospiraceae bacterium]RKJ62590.1 hypothetical protein D7Y06_16990 [Roseburia sp. 1XD42-69]
MEIIEHFLCGKENNPHTCEDGLILGEHIIGVIDGVTAKGKRLWDGKKSGCYAKEILQGAKIEDLEQNDIGRAGIAQNLKMQFAFENKAGYFGYPVLNGMGIDKSMIKRYPVKKGDVVILASDGYPVLRESLNQCERELDNLKKNDSMCFRIFPSTKGIKPGNVGFDDRAFCRFIV